MDQAWRVHRGWQVQAWTDIGRSSGGGGTSPLGNNDRRYGVEVQSPILDDRWRLFAFADRRSVDFQDQRIDPLWLGAGVRYRFGQLDAEAAVLRANDHVGDTGLRAGVGWQFNDYWHAGLVAARNDPEASMQARVAGITADSLSARVDYRRSELTHWMFGASRFRYDDGNHRELFSTALEQRLLTRPRWLVDGLASAYTSRGSRDDAPYFNPSRDRMVEIGLRIDQQLWRHYERHFRHRLTVSLGTTGRTASAARWCHRCPTSMSGSWGRAVCSSTACAGRSRSTTATANAISASKPHCAGETDMARILRLILLLLLSTAPTALAQQATHLDAADNGLLILSYHDIRDQVAAKGDADTYAVSTQNFAAHLDWLGAHGYHPVSLSQVIDASQGRATLPPQPVLLTFDDGLRSVYDKAFPLLQAYRYPALVAVITDYMDMAPGRTIDYGYRPFGHDDFLTWAQLKQMHDSGLIEVASHTDNLHHGVLANPQGNSTPAVVTRVYSPSTRSYETETQYEQRLRADLTRSAQRIEQHLGVRPARSCGRTRPTTN